MCDYPGTSASGFPTNGTDTLALELDQYLLAHQKFPTKGLAQRSNCKAAYECVSLAQFLLVLFLMWLLTAVGSQRRRWKPRTRPME